MPTRVRRWACAGRALAGAQLDGQQGLAYGLLRTSLCLGILGDSSEDADALLQQLAREEGLTGVAHRRGLDLQLQRELERARRCLPR